MSDLTSLTIEIDRATVAEADTIANAMGMTLSAAINTLIRQMIVERAIPNQIRLLDDEVEEFHHIIDNIRTESKRRGFWTDDEIIAEIAAYRKESKQSDE